MLNYILDFRRLRRLKNRINLCTVLGDIIFSCFVKFTKMMARICLPSLKLVSSDHFVMTTATFTKRQFTVELFCLPKWCSHIYCPTQMYPEVTVLRNRGLRSHWGWLFLDLCGIACPPSRLSQSNSSWVILWTGGLNGFMSERKKTCTNKADQLADLVHNTVPQSAVRVRGRDVNCSTAVMNVPARGKQQCLWLALPLKPSGAESETVGAIR